MAAKGYHCFKEISVHWTILKMKMWIISVMFKSIIKLFICKQYFNFIWHFSYKGAIVYNKGCWYGNPVPTWLLIKKGRKSFHAMPGHVLQQHCIQQKGMP